MNHRPRAVSATVGCGRRHGVTGIAGESLDESEAEAADRPLLERVIDRDAVASCPNGLNGGAPSSYSSVSRVPCRRSAMRTGALLSLPKPCSMVFVISSSSTRSLEGKLWSSPCRSHTASAKALEAASDS